MTFLQAAGLQAPESESSQQGRYALYYIPTGALFDWGAQLLGYNLRTKQDIAPPKGLGMPLPLWEQAIQRPRRYGFHATLKAPFYLTKGSSLEGLDQQLTLFSEAQKRFEISALSLGIQRRSFALELKQESNAMTQLHEAVLEVFDPFRAPLSEADYQRRLHSPLTEQQKSLLEKWGYPYVKEAFNFHLTVTSKFGETEQAMPDWRRSVEIWLKGQKDLFEKPISVEAISLCYQPKRDQRFYCLKGYSFKG